MHNIKHQDSSTVTFTLNGRTVADRRDESILQAAEQEGVEIPRLCYMEGIRADGDFRTCMVEIKGERVLAPSCCRSPSEGMEVPTDSARGDQPEDVDRAAAVGHP